MPRVALVFNLVKPDMLAEGPVDRSAEYDSEETLVAVAYALRAGVHELVRLEAD